jgi:hypothetical protein
MIAYCGLECDSCPIHQATFEPDKHRQQALRKSIAEQCSQLYGMNMQLEDVSDCDGCLSNSGRLFSGCNQCEIRKCAIRQNILNCAICSDFVCSILKEHFLHDPDAQIRLEKIHQGQ